MTDSTQSLFERQVDGIGHLALRPLRMPADVPYLHAWVTREHAAFWGMVGYSKQQVADAYVEIARRANVYVGLRNHEPAFLVECYEPSRDPVGEHYAVEPGDRGMHVLIAPSDRRAHGFSGSVFQFVMEFMFDDPAVSRVVVEPDIRNRRIHVLNRRAGFRYAKPIELPTKTAHLAFCSRAQFQAALRPDRTAAFLSESPEQAFTHLNVDTWATVNEALLRKTIAELAHELLIVPRPAGDEDRYVLQADAADTEYRLRARVFQLDHWLIEPGSLEKRIAGRSAPLDAVQFFLELNQQLGITAEMLPVYLEEITSTLSAAAYKRTHQQWTSADLVHAEFQEIEAAMTEGHPCFVANSGRVGFDSRDYLAYAPEVGSPMQLVWLAAHERNTEFNSIPGLSYAALLEQELGRDTITAFERELQTRGLEPRDYVFVPVHPWQWFEKLALVFAPDIATRDLVCLGYGEDSYRAQQSIRTLFNSSQPHKHYVKTALSVLNMGFMRGLSADYMRDTPAINQWLAELVDGDSYFASVGFGILREVASVGYRNPLFEQALPKGSPYRKLLAALWRESPITRLAEGQRVLTMASLLHRDRDGVALLPQLIQASGLSIDAWLERFLRCYLAPLLHCFYRYDLAFMPHGENVILKLEANAPVQALLKDTAEEVALMDGARVLPAQVQRIVVSVPEELKLLSIFTDVFDGFLRFMSPILVDQAGYSEDAFWERVAACVLEYRSAHPELADKLERYDLFVPEFLRSCLNRLQLRNNRQLIDLSDPAKNLSFAGKLKNPISKFG